MQHSARRDLAGGEGEDQQLVAMAQRRQGLAVAAEGNALRGAAVANRELADALELPRRSEWSLRGGEAGEECGKEVEHRGHVGERSRDGAARARRRA